MLHSVAVKGSDHSNGTYCLPVPTGAQYQGRIAFRSILILSYHSSRLL
jgi:hypothetical protein